MDQTGTERDSNEVPRGPGHRRFWATFGLSIFALALVLAVLGLSGRSIPLPGTLVNAVEARANDLLSGQARVRIGSGNLAVTRGFVPQVRFDDVTLVSAGGQRLASISDLRTALDARALLSGRLVPARISVGEARIAVRRTPDGAFDFAPAASGFSGTALDPASIFDAIDAAFATPSLSTLGEVQVENLALLFDDKRSGQVWRIDGGQVTLRQTPEAVETQMNLQVEGQTAALLRSGPEERSQTGEQAQPARASVDLTLSSAKMDSAMSLRAELSGVSARDLGAQVPSLAWLQALDAPISGQLRSGFDGSGLLTPVAVELTIGRGALQPSAGTPPIPFDGVDLRLTYNPDDSALSLTGLAIRSALLDADLEGDAWLKGNRNGIPEALVAQVRLTSFRADTLGLVAEPVSFTSGRLDARLNLDPFELAIGQLTLQDEHSRLAADGRIGATPDGWTGAVDLSIDRIGSRKLLALWPEAVVPRTRLWMAENVQSGELAEVKAAIRLAPGQAARLALDYRFDGADFRFMRTMPPVLDAQGYASLFGNRFALVAERGKVEAPAGGSIDISGSVLVIPDVRVKPGPLEITLRTDSTVTAVLSMLDRDPFNYLTKAGKPVDIVQGHAQLVTDLRLTPRKTMRPDDVRFGARGTLTGVQADKVIPGRVLAAQSLLVEAGNDELRLSGSATLDGVPAEGSWTQTLGPPGTGRSTTVAQIEVTTAALATFGIVLPEGAVRGSGRADAVIEIAAGQPPAFRLESTLEGLALAIPEIGWDKPAGEAGRLSLSGRFAQPTDVEALSFSAAGLDASGTLRLTVEGGLDTAEFSDVAVSDWFKGSATLTGQGQGAPIKVAVTGGSADMRRAEIGLSVPEAADRPATEVALSELRLTDGIALNDFRGTFSAISGGTGGQFAGWVNGRVPVAGEIVPDTTGQPVIRLRSDDAGAVLAAAGVYASGRGGEMDLVLHSLGTKGNYDGTIGIRNIRVVDAPGLASLLNAVSVVGLIDELRGAGIVFTDVEGRFGLMPDGVEIRQGSAIGPSLGVSLEGVYRAADESIDLRGVVSPLYLLNGIGQIFSSQRDGLFGFAYQLTGNRTNYDVAVNPLSILTPGMFRNIFRRAPPSFDTPSGG